MGTPSSSSAVYHYLPGWSPALPLIALFRFGRNRYVLIQIPLWHHALHATIVTTSRGYGNTRAMAEYVLASLFHFALSTR